MKFNLLAIVIIFFEAMVHLNFCEVAEADIRRMKVRLRTEDAPAGSHSPSCGNPSPYSPSLPETGRPSCSAVILEGRTAVKVFFAIISSPCRTCTLNSPSVCKAVSPISFSGSCASEVSKTRSLLIVKTTGTHKLGLFPSSTSI